MLATVRSGADAYNPHFGQLKRETKSEGNLAWLKRALRKRPKNKAAVVLLGGLAKSDIRLRLAQADAREDLMPSDWSHALVLTGHQVTPTAKICEVSLSESSSLGFPPSGNAVAEGTLQQFSDAKKYPNLAVLFIPPTSKQIADSIARFKAIRSQIDAVELKARWLPYLWGVGQGANPLHEGFGIPSAAFVEAIAAAHDFELTPGLASRSSCPEAIWQAARWWHEYHQDTSGGSKNACIHGLFTNEHHLGE